VTKSAWWVRCIAALPLPVLYCIARCASFLSYRVFPHRKEVVRENLSKAFPDCNEAQLREITRHYYEGFAQMFVELVKAASLPPDEIRRRVRIINTELPRGELERGTSVLLTGAHQCNWEWMLLAVSLQLGFPLDAAYKPLINSWAEREMLAIRRRFGARMIMADELLADIIKRRDVVRAIAMIADQEPTRSEHKHWVRFLNRDSAFFMGLEEIARVTRYPVFFMSLRRTARGYYEMQFKPLAAAGERLAQGELTERYARLVEEQIRAAPADWPWSHKRWRLKKSLYS
jgi:Kdo2-lipid IVA lauroyltransferase/acyltransferase